MVEFDRSAFIGKFQEEAGEYLQRLNEGVINLEVAPDDEELIQQMLRDAHTLKGSSRMVGLMDVSDISHRLEDIMVRLRDKDLSFSPEMSDLFFEALDVIVFLSEHAQDEEHSDVDVDGLCARLTTLAEEGVAETGDGAPEPEEKKGKKKPAAKKKAAEKKEPSGKKKAAGKKKVAEEQEQGDATEEAAPKKRKKGAAKSQAQPTIRVKTAQVDSLLNLVSEVVISQIKADGHAVEVRGVAGEAAELWQEWSRVRSALLTPGAAEQLEGEAFADSLDHLDELLSDHRKRLASFAKSHSDDVSRASSVIGDLQEEGMRLRMLPVGTLFNSFPRAVRDLAKEFGKDVDLIMEGEDTELDKKVLEEINDPLIHILRNAVDHGIEKLEERKEAGKPAKGTIRMGARQEGDHIVIEVTDDGKGIDPDLVRNSAVKKGYLTESEARALSDREALFLIFESGFSTSAIITEISGRGVGMDVVRQFVVDKLKGSMHVESERGQGTTFALTIPLTLAIIRALILRVGPQMFSIPTATIEETLRIEPSDVVKVEGREIIRRQRRNIPLVRLGDVIDVTHADKEEGSKIPVIIVGFSGHRVGFVADGLMGEQQIVIKTLGSHLQRVENVAGVTVLGAGQVVPILNVPDLVTNAREISGLRGRRAATAGPEEGEPARRILICEDSFTTRELERSIFEAAGYEVEVATDGQEGLDKLREGVRVDAVVTDVQMPRLNGFDLTRAIKGAEAFEQIPVIVVTSLEREEEKAEGIEAGADAYITKSVFNQDTLLDTVERLIQ